MRTLMTLQSGKQTSGLATSMWSSFPCLNAAGDQGYAPLFALVAKRNAQRNDRNGRRAHAFFAGSEEFSGMLKT